MKALRNITLLFFLGIFIYSCGSSAIKSNSNQKEEPVVIANKSLEYEIIIIDPGFNLYLNSIAKPVDYYSLNYLENQNRLFVANWNYRARNLQQFDPNIYENVIDYNPNVKYGYDVNYKLFNYFLFAQQKYKMSLNSSRPNRIN